jgi:hypothetical protein
MGIIEIIGQPESILVLSHRFLAFGTYIVSSPLGLSPQGTCTSLDPLQYVATTPLEFGFCLD